MCYPCPGGGYGIGERDGDQGPGIPADESVMLRMYVWILPYMGDPNGLFPQEQCRGEVIVRYTHRTSLDHPLK